MKWHAQGKRILTVMVTGLVSWTVALSLGQCEVAGALAQTAEQERMAVHLATLLRSGRAVISNNQALINDETKGDKGLTGEKVVALAKENYKKATNRELDKVDRSTVEGKLTQAMLESMKEVMDKAQPLINKKGVEYKGFLPAVFAKQVGDAFRKKADGVADIKLTAPKDYVRNRANAPDAWEDLAIESQFKSNGWAKGKAYTEMKEHKGKPAFRLIIPEYYVASCLECHGEPKGAEDPHGGGKKEGGKLDELGGAISVAIYIK
ncbi:MAG: hypothetical protein C3F12_12660 [Candidatus Methylomirabilota bacterium]|nr:DUF3365 domain-containing protein [Candidatus Methylomirabilis sp.]PWB43509.1 MAG: hypothetical protein C3F12_12660 [candidate division NC10 bacterium]